MRPYDFGIALAIKLAEHTAGGIDMRDASPTGAVGTSRRHSTGTADPFATLRKATSSLPTPKGVLANSALNKKASITGSKPRPLGGPANAPLGSASKMPTPPAAPAAPMAPAAPKPPAPPAPAMPLGGAGRPLRAPGAVAPPAAAPRPLAARPAPRGASAEPGATGVARLPPPPAEAIRSQVPSSFGVGTANGYVSRPLQGGSPEREQVRRELMTTQNAPRETGPYGSLGGSNGRVEGMKLLAQRQQAEQQQGVEGPTAFSQLPDDQKWMQVRQRQADLRAQQAQTRALRQQQTGQADQLAAAKFPIPGGSPSSSELVPTAPGDTPGEPLAGPAQASPAEPVVEPSVTTAPAGDAGAGDNLADSPPPPPMSSPLEAPAALTDAGPPPPPMSSPLGAPQPQFGQHSQEDAMNFARSLGRQMGGSSAPASAPPPRIESAYRPDLQYSQASHKNIMSMRNTGIRGSSPGGSPASTGTSAQGMNTPRDMQRFIELLQSALEPYGH